MGLSMSAPVEGIFVAIIAETRIATISAMIMIAGIAMTAMIVLIIKVVIEISAMIASMSQIATMTISLFVKLQHFDLDDTGRIV